jgi:hypothetical protein
MNNHQDKIMTLKKKVIAEVVRRWKQEEDCENNRLDRATESAFIRGYVSEVLGEDFSLQHKLLPLDCNALSDFIYLLGQDVEIELGYL